MLQTLLATECFYKNVQLLSGSADEHTSLICMIREKNTEVKQQANKKNKNVAKQITYYPAIHLPLQLWQN